MGTATFSTHNMMHKRNKELSKAMKIDDAEAARALVKIPKAAQFINVLERSAVKEALIFHEAKMSVKNARLPKRADRRVLQVSHTSDRRRA